MKLHRLLVDAVIGGLSQIFYQQHSADKVVETLLKSNKKWGARDRAFIAETLYEVVRWWRKLTYIADLNPKNTADLWQIIGVWFWLNEIELPDWSEFSELEKSLLEKNTAEAEDIRKIRESIPDWLDTLGEAELGEIWNAEIEALNSPAEVYLRTNTLKTTREILKEKLLLDDFDLEEIPDSRVGLRLINRKNLRSNEFYKKGHFEIQDAGSQRIAEFFLPRSSSICIDACAGAGGKTLHLAALMHNKGKIIAMDLEEDKLNELQIRAKRNGVNIIQTEVIKKHTVEKFANFADYLLLDVPCSGLGVLRRNPDSKWRLTPQFLEKLKIKQAEILQNYSKMLRPGGRLVYATCSILPSENQNQIQNFLSKNPEFEFIKEEKFLASEQGFDGFYMALLQKKSS